MEQVQPAEIKHVIEHAARKIEIIYEQGKTDMTPLDKQFLDAYIKLHDFEAEVLAIANKLFHSFIPVSKELEDLGEALKKVKNSFNDCNLMADKLCTIDYNAEEVSLEKLAKNQEQTGKEMLGFSGRIMKVYETVKGLSAEVDKYNKANEDQVNNLYEVYSKIRTAHSVNWEKILLILLRLKLNMSGFWLTEA